VQGFLVRCGIAAIGLWVAAKLLSGVRFESDATLLLAALLLGVVNALVRPLVVVLTFPITVITLGAFLWVVNAAMLSLVAALLDGFELRGFGSALLGSLIVGFTGWVASWWIGPRGRVEMLVVHEERRPAA
jgi:putative membrane protein